MTTKKHSHSFVETYRGMIGFGLDRPTNESTVVWCLQKLSDDRLMAHLAERLSDAELESIFDLVTSTLKKHLSEEEYHELFLKDPQ